MFCILPLRCLTIARQQPSTGESNKPKRSKGKTVKVTFGAHF
jgi:hypothetical protein